MNTGDIRQSLVGRTLGRFEIVAELGQGAMGVVYEARDPAIGRRVAIKTVRAGLATSVSDDMLERFRREARAAGTLSHQNIVTVYDVGEQDGVTYIAMEFLDGRPLDEVLADRRCIPVDECVELMAKVLEGLGHAHEHGVVHRDVKPANIVVSENGTVKVADFGVAHTLDSELTRTGMLIGTPHYMSPEQFAAGRIDGRSDLFSVASILYEMLTGERPFHGDNLGAMMHNVMNTEPVPVRKINVHVPEPLAGVIEKAMSKDPQRRYQTADDFVAALRESVKESPDPAVMQLERDRAGAQPDTGAATLVTSVKTVVAGPDREAGPGETVSGPSSRLRLALTLGAVLAIVALAVGGLLYLRLRPVQFDIETAELDADTFEPVSLEGVTVYISGGEFGTEREEIGKTPSSDISKVVQGGQYTMHFVKPGYFEKSVDVELVPGSLCKVPQVTMVRETGTAGPR